MMLLIKKDYKLKKILPTDPKHLKNKNNKLNKNKKKR